jgi:hypothetical protein
MKWLSRLFRRSATSRLDLALAKLDSSTERFRLTAETLAPAQARLFWDLAAAGADLRGEIEADPALIAPLRRIIFFYLPKMSELCARWAALASRDPLTPPNAAALDEFQGYLNVLSAAVEGCRSRRQDALTQVMAVFDEQLKQIDR